MKSTHKTSRVDIQMSVISTILIILSIVCVVVFQYIVNYREATEGFAARADYIHSYFNDIINNEYGGVITQDDVIDNLSKHTAQIKKYAYVNDIYFAVEDENKNLVRYDDTQNSAVYIGVYDILKEAFGGKVIIPNNMIKMSDSHIFVACYPIRSLDGVCGVLVIEFDGERQYSNFVSILVGTPVIGIISSLFAVIIAFFKFKRVSNPTYQDMANTDYLSQMKSRNSFDTDMFNIQNSGNLDRMAMICIDLNGLKKINDTYGHIIGDSYISAASKVIKQSLNHNQIAYRIGGDEFVIMLWDSDCEEAESIINNIRNNIQVENERSALRLSVAIGYAVYDSTIDKTLYNTFERADTNMYNNKKLIKNNA